MILSKAAAAAALMTLAVAASGGPAMAAVRTVTGATTFNMPFDIVGPYGGAYATVFNVGRLNTANFSFTFDEASRFGGSTAAYKISDVALSVNGVSLADGASPGSGLIVVENLPTLDIYLVQWSRQIDLSPDIPVKTNLQFSFEVRLTDGVAADGLPPHPSEFNGHVDYIRSSASLATPPPYPDGVASYVQLEGDNVLLQEASPTPEPSAWALMLAGFGLSGGALRRERRRRRRQNEPTASAVLGTA